jgi:hypothetical protein
MPAERIGMRDAREIIERGRGWAKKHRPKPLLARNRSTRSNSKATEWPPESIKAQLSASRVAQDEPGLAITPRSRLSNGG